MSNKEVYVWGDSHWRNFFPFLNTGSPGVIFEKDGISFIDMVANELSGATMYGLANINSKNGARRRILKDIHFLKDASCDIENIALTFGEVDVRYHNHHYFSEDRFLISKAKDTIEIYKNFIDSIAKKCDNLKNVFIYWGFYYPRGEETLLQPHLKMGKDSLYRANAMLNWMEELLPKIESNIIKLIMPEDKSLISVSDDGVHLDPKFTFENITFPFIKKVLND